jgi:hypothetical protein
MYLVSSAIASSYCMFPFAISGLDQELVSRSRLQLKAAFLDPPTGAF